jgi:hypothetical protein
MGIKEFVPYLQAKLKNEPTDEALNKGVQALQANHFRYQRFTTAMLRNRLSGFGACKPTQQSSSSTLTLQVARHFSQRLWFSPLTQGPS